MFIAGCCDTGEVWENIRFWCASIGLGYGCCDATMFVMAVCVLFGRWCCSYYCRENINMRRY